MRQHSIDLLPESIRMRCLARVRTGQTIGAFTIVIVTLVLVISYGRFDLTQGEHELQRMRQQADIVLSMESRAMSLEQQIEDARAYLELYHDVAPPVDVASIVATIINELPDSVALDRIDLDAGARVRIRTARSRGSSAADDEAPAPRILNCEIAGFAVSDEQVAEIVDRLRSTPPFERVSLDFSRTRLVREKPAREFRLSCRVDLDRMYSVSSLEPTVATAEGGSP